MTINLNWLVILFIILKLTGVIHLSWWWLAIPGALFMFCMGFSLLMTALGLGVMNAALKNPNIKWTVKK